MQNTTNASPLELAICSTVIGSGQWTGGDDIPSFTSLSVGLSMLFAFCWIIVVVLSQIDFAVRIAILSSCILFVWYLLLPVSLS